MDFQYEELCLAGACNRGMCYIGCIKRLEELNLLNLKKISGVSIGSFIAACYIIGFTTDEMLDIIIKKDTKDFKDLSFINGNGAILKGSSYRKWVYEVLELKIDPNITLIELYNKTKIDFIITATCLYSPSSIDGGEQSEFSEGITYFSHTLTPDMPLITAINASMSFPFIFPPMVYKNCHFIDGGVLDNFPMDQLSNKALGLRVNFTPINGLTSTQSPISYVGKIFELLSTRIKKLNPSPSKNVVFVSCEDFGIIDFEMSIDDKITLYKRGYTSMSTFIDLALEEPPQITEPLNDEN